MLKRIEAGIDNITYDLAKKLDLQGKKMREIMKPGEIILTNAQKWRSEAQQTMFEMLRDSSPPMFVIRTAQEQVEGFKKYYDNIRILDKAFNVYGKPLPSFWGTIVGIPKPTPAQTA